MALVDTDEIAAVVMALTCFVDKSETCALLNVAISVLLMAEKSSDLINVFDSEDNVVMIFLYAQYVSARSKKSLI
jgi:hypothetical protein